VPLVYNTKPSAAESLPRNPLFAHPDTPVYAVPAIPNLTELALFPTVNPTLAEVPVLTFVIVDDQTVASELSYI
jgi:hypothetical protein